MENESQRKFMEVMQQAIEQSKAIEAEIAEMLARLDRMIGGASR
ncbi:hypothetical protein [Virgibacillus dakarensis]|nr:hypothetical protein [Virgibacillus dakarensis]